MNSNLLNVISISSALDQLGFSISLSLFAPILTDLHLFLTKIGFLLADFNLSVILGNISDVSLVPVMSAYLTMAMAMAMAIILIIIVLMSMPGVRCHNCLKKGIVE